MATGNLIRNPDFLTAAADHPHRVYYWTTADPDQEVYVTEARHQLTRPDGWEVWVEHAEEADLPWDPGAGGWSVPEVKLGEEAFQASRWLQLPDGSWARPVQAFIDHKHSRCGPFQSVAVTPGTAYTLSAWAHAWNSNGGPEVNGVKQHHPNWSDGVGYAPFAMAYDDIPGSYPEDANLVDILQSIVFRLGIDPTGGIDPFGPHVVWGPRWTIYNIPYPLPALTVTAQADTLTVFAWMENRWRNAHNDRYLTHVVLTAEGEPPPPPEPGGVRRSLAGVHLLGDHGFVDDHLRGMVADGVSLVSVKAVASLGVLQDVKAVDPDILTVGRFIDGTDPDVDVEGPDLTDPEAAAEAVWASLRPLWAQHRAYVDYWEVTNEADPSGPEGHRKLARFFLRFLDLCEPEGYKIAALSYSLGVPEYDEMQAVAATGLLARLKAGGHALALHEYADPLDKWYGDPIPGAQADPRRGPLAFRYRFWEDVVGGPAGMPDVFLTEVNVAHDLRDLDADTWRDQVKWYVNNAADDLYVRGVLLFTWGVWDAFDLSIAPYDDTWEALARDTAVLPSTPLPPVVPPTALPVAPYDKVYHVVEADIPPERRKAIYLYAAEVQQTVGPAATDAVAWATELLDAGRSVTLVAWDRTPADHPKWRAWAAAIDPRIAVVFKPDPTPPAPNPTPPIPYCQRDPDWAGIVMAPSTETVGGSGCLVTAFASLFTLTDPAVDPGVLARWLVAHGGFLTDGRLLITKPAEFTPDWEFVWYHTWMDGPADLTTVRRLLAQGPTILGVDFVPATSRYDSHFVLALREEAGDIVVIDPWTGTVCKLLETYGLDWTLQRAIYAAVEYRRTAPGGTETPRLGFNDPENVGAGMWMAANGGNLLVVPLAIGTHFAALDFSVYEAAGIRVIVNLRYGWSTDCGGAGTLPVPGSSEWHAFIQAATLTINAARGVWAWELFNEMNNPREFPHGADLTPGTVATAYNAIRHALTVRRLAVGALDPYHATHGDPRAWLQTIYSRITGAEFIAAHGYIRGPDTALVGSDAKFADDPLRWQYLNYPGCVTEPLKALPAPYRSLPVYVTEANHLWRTSEAVGDYGWVTDARAGAVVHEFYAAAALAGFAGLALYRWTGDAWALRTNGAVLEAVRALV